MGGRVTGLVEPHAAPAQSSNPSAVVMTGLVPVTHAGPANAMPGACWDGAPPRCGSGWNQRRADVPVGVGDPDKPGHDEAGGGWAGGRACRTARCARSALDSLRRRHDRPCAGHPRRAGERDVGRLPETVSSHDAAMRELTQADVPVGVGDRDKPGHDEAGGGWWVAGLVEPHAAPAQPSIPSAVVMTGLVPVTHAGPANVMSDACPRRCPATMRPCGN